MDRGNFLNFEKPVEASKVYTAPGVDVRIDTLDGQVHPEEWFYSQSGLEKVLERKHKKLGELEQAMVRKNRKIAELESNLARKYRHCTKLKERISQLENQLFGCDLEVDSEEDFNDFNWHVPAVMTSQSGMESAMGDNGEPGVSVDEPASRTTEQITAFADEDAGWQTMVHSEYDETRDTVAAGDTDLGNFLGRPIRALQTSWVVGQPLFTAFNPWTAFQLNDAVNDKLGNYELLRYKLHMKIVISGTPFHYGRAIVSYNPLSGLDDVTVTRNFLDVDVIGASQRPHFWLNPTTNEGGEMCMPFFWYDNYLSLSKADAALMGEVSIKSLGNLRHANGGDDPVTVTVFLWASDVVLTMPTSLTDPTSMRQNLILASQAGKQSSKSNNNNTKRTKGKGNSQMMNSGDEYGSGIISKPAAVVAKAAGVLEQIPMIAPYARATSMIADKVGKVAAIFGFSRPAVITDIEPFKPNPTGNLANVDAADAVHKLTLDSKQELTIDSRTVGLDGTDQMGITDIACRESYLTSFSWSTADPVDGILWNSYVTPNLFGVNSTECHPTPMSMLAQIFRDWQGSLKFRFQIVKSQYHKGRMLIRYDPRSHSPTIEYNENYSRVVDISEEDDFEIIIGWGQSDPFLDCSPQMSPAVVNYGTTRLPTDNNQRFNGVLELNVLNALVSPSVDSDITVNVFVSMCDDAKFAFPAADKLRNLHYFPLVTPTAEPFQAQENPGLLISQSGMASSDMPMGASKLQTIAEEGPAADHTFEVFYGDVPVSLRDIFKRYIKTRTRIPEPPDTTDTYRTHQFRDKVFPYHSGWDPSGVDRSAVNGTTPLTVSQTTPLNFMAPCYAGWRGGIRRKFVYHASDKPRLLQPYVNAYNFGSPNEIQRDKPFATSNAELGKWLSSSWNQFTLAGSTTTNIGVNNTIEVEFPFYQDARFRSTRIIEAGSLPGNSYQHGVTSYKDGTGSMEISQTTAFDEYVATGEDFSLFFWSGAPIIYNYSVNDSS